MREPRSRRESALALGLLAGLAVLAVVLRAELGSAASRLFPLLLAVVSAVAAVLVARHGNRLDRRSRRPWRALATVAALLTAGQLISLVDTPDGHGQSAWAQLPQIAAVPLALATCLLLLPPRTGRSRGVRELLDGAIVLAAVVLVGVVVLSDAMARSTGVLGALLVVGYPVSGALLCGVGLMTVTRVDRTRRRAAVWLLVAMAALVVVAVSGALANVLGVEASGMLTILAWTGMAAAAIRAVGNDPGAPLTRTEDSPAPALFGVVVSHGTAYGVAAMVVLVLSAGHTFSSLGQVLTGVVIVLTSARGVLWATDAARLTRRLVQTEAYLRALAASAEDVTLVLDEAGSVRWLSGAVQGQLGWHADDLTGRRLADLLDPADREVLERVVADVGVAPAASPTVRLRTGDGEWRDVELSGAARAGVPGTALREGLVLHVRDVTARRSNQRELERMAYTDYLTGLPNRARFMAALDEALARAADGAPNCMLLVDLDGFKAVNDVAGHDAGDHLLVQVADQLRAGAREQDLVARLGGDEFALLVPGGPDEAMGLAERLVVALDRSFRAPTPGDDGAGPLFAVSGSIGLAELDGSGDVPAVVRQADLALRAAKAAGKRCVRSSGEAVDAALGRRTRLARDLPAALEDGQLRVLYQPVVGLHDRRVLGLEALVRWEHPLLGTVPPDEFIHLAEEDGLIVPLQRWVFGEATRQAAVLMAGGWDVQMGVNVSVRHLLAGCLVPDVAAALSAAQLPPGKLILELTESVLLDAHQERLVADLETLRGMGVVLSLDDFGRGWSSLAYLARLPVQILKMDREFIADVDTDPRGRALVASIVELGRTLGMDVVAEGVETESQLAELRAMDCRYLQGYLFGRPMPFAELRALLDAFDPVLLDTGAPDLDSGVHLVGPGG
ncbi:putative bifunctional diguanylate cyclase/phosphodiesterase [Blastococcus saxobsidens]|uniref:PAS domain S-box-containing protein/diguanylate cyclase (GGDEF)-like protein n=1 Tax=Blastococcus saxobsidens TaxID=138336 RepID=A0A4Q7Y9R7_9ACTN|nr:GGDEF domain-containing phosphodiesterase [Blastococcus saxobsidens]RZU32795.1 PAS domain S-box-containing protein/diguanylate cyclase (GGDEF)-like protein [Blastococcus saxobsidens]